MATNDPLPAGPAMRSMGNAYTGVNASWWNLFHNPAGIAGVRQIQGGFFAEQRYLLSQLNNGAAGVVLPFHEIHTAALSFSSFGYQKYQDSRIALSYGVRVLEKVNLGLTGAWNMTAIQDYGSNGAFTLDAGAIIETSSKVSVGFRVYNATQSYIRKEQEEVIPTVFNAGIAWKPSEKILICADLEKTLMFAPSLRGGVQYQINEILIARFGIQTRPSLVSLGMGCRINKFQLDLGAGYDLRLGLSPVIGIRYPVSGGKDE